MTIKNNVDQKDRFNSGQSINLVQKEKQNKTVSQNRNTINIGEKKIENKVKNNSDDVIVDNFLGTKNPPNVGLKRKYR